MKRLLIIGLLLLSSPAQALDLSVFDLTLLNRTQPSETAEAMVLGMVAAASIELELEGNNCSKGKTNKEIIRGAFVLAENTLEEKPELKSAPWAVMYGFVKKSMACDKQ